MTRQPATNRPMISQKDVSLLKVTVGYLTGMRPRIPEASGVLPAPAAPIMSQTPHFQNHLSLSPA